MPKKLRRGRGRNMFGRRKHGWVKVIGWILLIGLAGLAGVGVTALIKNMPETPAQSDISAPAGSESSAPAGNESSEPDAPPAQSEPEPAPVPTATRAVFLPLAQLRDEVARAARLDTLKEQGYTAVIFDLKPADGTLHYAFSGEWATKAKTVAEDAMTAQELAALLADCESRGMTAIPRLFAFEDSGAPGRLKSARINWAGDKTTLGLDAKVSNGGKPWLNPYSEDAHAYLLELATELKAAGVKALLFDGVRFPNNSYEAYFGTAEQTADTRAQVLTAFVGKLQAALGEETSLMLAMELSAATAADTAVYGGNPLTFGADAVCPVIDAAALNAHIDAVDTPVTPSAALTDVLSLIDTRLTFVNGEKPSVLPWLLPDVASLTAGFDSDTDHIVTVE